jgi:hypothetical protein
MAALTPRHTVLGAALLLTLAATVYVAQAPAPPGDDLLATPRAPLPATPGRSAPPASAAPAAHDGPPPPGQATPRIDGAAAHDLFAAHDWRPPAPPPPPAVAEVPAPPPPRVAPPLPFRYLGRLEEPDGRVAVFLLRSGAGNERQQPPIVVRVGDLIAPHHRVDQIGPRSMRLTYLPLAQAQTLSFTAAP